MSSALAPTVARASSTASVTGASIQTAPPLTRPPARAASRHPLHHLQPLADAQDPHVLCLPLPLRDLSHGHAGMSDKTIKRIEEFVAAAGAAMGSLVLAPVVAASPARAGWWPEVPSIETGWNITAILSSAAIAAGAAILAARWSAKSTMANARELQDRERRNDEESCAAILAADLQMKLTDILTCFEEPTERQVVRLAIIVNPSTKVLDAVLPKMGGLGQDGAANLLNAYRGVEFVVDDSKRLSLRAEDANFAAQHADAIAKQSDFVLARTRDVARDLGGVIVTLWHRYHLTRPRLYEESGVDLEALGFKELKDLGL